MKETYFVGYDPEIKMWDAQLLTPNFSEQSWVFKVTARSNHDALIQGLDQYKQLTQKLTGDEMRLANHIHREVLQKPRSREDVLMVDIPTRYLESAAGLSKRGFFTLAHREDALVVMWSAGWKALDRHVRDQISLDREMDDALCA